MRIAMVSEHANPLATLGDVDAGGQNVHVAELAAGLAALGHEVSVYSRWTEPMSELRLQAAEGYTVVHVPVGPPAAMPKDDLLPLMPLFASWMAEDWQGHGRPDVVHAHFWMSGLAALDAAQPLGIPVATTFHALGTVKKRHQGAADTSPPGRLELERRIANDSALIIATCRDEVTELRAMGVDHDRIVVIPCGVDTSVFTPGPAAPPRPAGARTQLLSVGRLVPRKGFETAIRMLHYLPEAELTIVGGPPVEHLDVDPEACRLQRLAIDLGVADRVRLVGARAHADMPAHYRAADVVVTVPWYEPFGITPLEAAACGRPVVGSAVGGILDSVEHGRTGLHVAPKDPGSLARAVWGLATNEDRLHDLGRHARTRAVQLFDWSVVARRTESALSDVIPALATVPDATELYLGAHAEEIKEGLDRLLDQAPIVSSWGRRLATTLTNGGRLLVAGNGGSAAEAQHLTAELVGRWVSDRRPLSGIALTAETSSLTAILNDYGPDEVFARQVEAHGRPGDVLCLLSTSGSSSNVLHAAKRARARGLEVWALTGSGPNALSALADETIAISATSTAGIQELHLVAIHGICAALDAELERLGLMEAGPVCRQAS